jgi:hypothetical protein
MCMQWKNMKKVKHFLKEAKEYNLITFGLLTIL